MFPTAIPIEWHSLKMDEKILRAAADLMPSMPLWAKGAVLCLLSLGVLWAQLRNVFQDLLQKVSPKRDVRSHAEALKLLYEISALRKNSPAANIEKGARIEGAWNEAVLVQEARLREELTTSAADRSFSASVRVMVSSVFMLGATGLPIVMQWVFYLFLRHTSGWTFFLLAAFCWVVSYSVSAWVIGLVCARFLGKRLTDPQSLWADERFAETRAALNWVFTAEVLVAIAYVPWAFWR
jgi:hypothetical protein